MRTPESIDLLYLLGQAYQQLGKNAVDRIQQKDSESSSLEQLLAENYAASGYQSVAMLHLENALKASPARAGLHIADGRGAAACRQSETRRG